MPLRFVCLCVVFLFFFFFFNDTATTEIYTLSLHDALPISYGASTGVGHAEARTRRPASRWTSSAGDRKSTRPELQSHLNLVCRLLLDKKKNKTKRAEHERYSSSTCDDVAPVT